MATLLKRRSSAKGKSSSFDPDNNENLVSTIEQRNEIFLQDTLPVTITSKSFSLTTTTIINNTTCDCIGHIPLWDRINKKGYGILFRIERFATTSINLKNLLSSVIPSTRSNTVDPKPWVEITGNSITTVSNIPNQKVGRLTFALTNVPSNIPYEILKVNIIKGNLISQYEDSFKVEKNALTICDNFAKKTLENLPPRTNYNSIFYKCNQ